VTEEEQRRAMDVAQITALAELVRILIGEIALTGSQERFRENLAFMERAAIGALQARPLGGEMDEATAAFVKSAGSGYIGRLLGSIRHPDDPTPGG
jgi:hypothetical protein